MRRRLLLLLAVPALALGATSGCAKDVSPAARVGDLKVSDSELLDEVDEWAHNEAAFDQTELEGLNPGTYPMRLVDVILQQRIDLELHKAEFESLALELTDDLRANAVSLLFRGDTAAAQQALAGFSVDYAAEYVDSLGRQLAVEQELGQEGYLAWRTTAYRDANIEVSPRYGSWDEDAQSVVAPEGPSQPSGLQVDL